MTEAQPCACCALEVGVHLGYHTIDIGDVSYYKAIEDALQFVQLQTHKRRAPFTVILYRYIFSSK